MKFQEDDDDEYHISDPRYDEQAIRLWKINNIMIEFCQKHHDRLVVLICKTCSPPSNKICNQCNKYEHRGHPLLPAICRKNTSGTKDNSSQDFTSCTLYLK